MTPEDSIIRKTGQEYVKMDGKQENRWQGISGSTLKLIGVITMLIDHIAAAVIVRMAKAHGASVELWDVYEIMRDIGRTAFPIYCFMLIEGLKHTRSRWRYAARLWAFAFLSEIPFDLAFKSRILEFGYQNVFFTLAIGLVSLIALDEIDKKVFLAGNREADTWAKMILSLAAALGGMLLALFLRTDYSWMGVACILLMYLLRKWRGAQLAAGYAAFVVLLGEIAAWPAFLTLALYRGKKGGSAKYFFYGFYPMHLILLYLVCVLMGIALYPAI